MFANYGKISSELYNLTKPVGMSIDGDIEYYMERLHHVNGRVLEAGVGTGRFLIPLLQRGFIIDGVDASSEMLKLCRQNCDELGLAPNLFVMDLVNLQLDHLYKAIVMPTGSFCLIEHRADALKVLRNFLNHLEVGGRIIIDLLLPDDFTAGEITTEVFPISDDVGIVLERKAQQIDWLNQSTLTLLKYEKWKNGQLINTELQKFPLNWYGVEEFKLILQNIGFKNITCSADYTYRRYPTDAKQIITFEAEKDAY